MMPIPWAYQVEIFITCRYTQKQQVSLELDV